MHGRVHGLAGHSHPDGSDDRLAGVGHCKSLRDQLWRLIETVRKHEKRRRRSTALLLRWSICTYSAQSQTASNGREPSRQLTT